MQKALADMDSLPGSNKAAALAQLHPRLPELARRHGAVLGTAPQSGSSSSIARCAHGELEHVHAHVGGRACTCVYKYACVHMLCLRVFACEVLTLSSRSRVNESLSCSAFVLLKA